MFYNLLQLFKFTFLQIRFILERHDLTTGLRLDVWEVGLLLAAFTVAQLTYYSCLPYMLKLSTAAELHLSHLATDFYSILAGVFFFHTKVSWQQIKLRFLYIKSNLLLLGTFLCKKEKINF